MREKNDGKRYIVRSIYLYPEDIQKLEEIAEKIGARSISHAIRILINNVEVKENKDVVVKIVADVL